MVLKGVPDWRGTAAGGHHGVVIQLEMSGSEELGWAVRRLCGAVNWVPVDDEDAAAERRERRHDFTAMRKRQLQQQQQPWCDDDEVGRFWAHGGGEDEHGLDLDTAEAGKAIGHHGWSTAETVMVD